MKLLSKVVLILGIVVGWHFVALAAEPAGITIDKAARTVSIAAKVAPRKLPNLSDVYPIEVIASWPAPKGKKAHETVVTFDVSPSDVAKALESLGLMPGKPAKGEGTAAAGPEVRVLLEFTIGDEPPARLPIEKMLVDRKTGRPLPALKWHFTGSVLTQPDPTKDERVYGADQSGVLIALFPVTDETVLQSSLTMKEEPLIKLETNKRNLPAEGTEVKLILEVK